MNILASAAYIGETGYNIHSQKFLRELSKHIALKIRNFTVYKNFNILSKDPHGIDASDLDKTLLGLQTLRTSTGFDDAPIYNFDKNYKYDIDLVLAECNHYYYSTVYKKFKIFYNVYEKTEYPIEFFEKLQQADQIWVPTQWQADNTIRQGIPQEKVKIVHEGIDETEFFPENLHTDKFTFLVIGNWTYRKSTYELVKSFVELFGNNPNVELLLSCDTPCFTDDNLGTTENRLNHFCLNSNNIKIVHFSNRQDHIKMVKSANVYLSCTRSEGWSLPLIEAMACGIPSIYSNCSGQLEFANGLGIPIDVFGENKDTKFYDPDYNMLKEKMLEVYNSFSYYKQKAVEQSNIIRWNFTWKDAALQAVEILNNIQTNKQEIQVKQNNSAKINVNFINGAVCEILNTKDEPYKVDFINKTTDTIEHQEMINSNHWTKALKQYYVDWKILVDDNFQHDLNLKNQRVYIALDSKSLGDTIAWFPYVEEFRKKHNCIVICSTFWNRFFKDNYQEIRFVEPGTTVQNLYAMYTVGYFYNSDNSVDYNKNPYDPKTVSLQRVSSDILGIDYAEIRPKIRKFPNVVKENIVSIAIHSTTQSRYWNNPTGWQEVTDYLKSIGYKVVIVSNEADGYMGNKYPIGAEHLKGSISDTVKMLQKSKLFIGISSGLSWLSWALETPLIVISGDTNPITEMKDCTRIFVSDPKTICNSCFNRYRLNSSDWNWCPDQKNTPRQFQCSKTISASTIIDSIKHLLNP